MPRPLNVAIIGAGMGGLAAAAALRKVGIGVTVYEQARQFARLGAGIQVGCNAMKVLRWSSGCASSPFIHVPGTTATGVPARSSST
jgi:2-polyprenyl-6-methoxyphenol hydroxylase-like FAD-dependent oxidoreductase